VTESAKDCQKPTTQNPAIVSLQQERESRSGRGSGESPIVKKKLKKDLEKRFFCCNFAGAKK
jgi:hypothetical protein